MTEHAQTEPGGRRNFFVRMFMGLGLALSYGTGAVYALQFLFPRRQTHRYRRLLVTTLDELPLNSSKVFKDLSEREMVLVHSESGLIALSTTCTHLGCKVYWQEQDQQFFCPCHDGYFDSAGQVLSGPPPRPLDAYDVEVADNRLVFVHVREI